MSDKTTYAPAKGVYYVRRVPKNGVRLANALGGGYCQWELIEPDGTWLTASNSRGTLETTAKGLNHQKGLVEQ